MKEWKRIETSNEKSSESWQRMFRRACSQRQITSDVRKRFEITEMRYKTDGVSTAAVVSVREAPAPGASPTGIVAHGYGVAVRAVGDEFNEHLGANRALRRAFDSAAAVITHRVGKRQKAAAAK